MKKANRSDSEIDDHLKKRLFGISVALDLFDKNKDDYNPFIEDWCAELIAKEIFILLIHEGNNKSIVHSLGIKDKLNIFDTSSPKGSISNFDISSVTLNISKTNPYIGLVSKKISNSISLYRPIFLHHKIIHNGRLSTTWLV